MIFLLAIRAEGVRNTTQTDQSDVHKLQTTLVLSPMSCGWLGSASGFSAPVVSAGLTPVGVSCWCWAGRSQKLLFLL